jgi:hypothetical protein
VGCKMGLEQVDCMIVQELVDYMMVKVGYSFDLAVVHYKKVPELEDCMIGQEQGQEDYIVAQVLADCMMVMLLVDYRMEKGLGRCMFVQGLVDYRMGEMLVGCKMGLEQVDCMIVQELVDYMMVKVQMVCIMGHHNYLMAGYMMMKVIELVDCRRVVV